MNVPSDEAKPSYSKRLCTTITSFIVWSIAVVCLRVQVVIIALDGEQVIECVLPRVLANLSGGGEHHDSQLYKQTNHTYAEHANASRTCYDGQVDDFTRHAISRVDGAVEERNQEW